MRELSTCTVLVVDDTETNIDILVKILEDDYELKVAMDGPGALEIAAESPPDLILLDIMMPGMDGYEVITKLKGNDQTKDIPVIFCTAMTEVEDETRGLALGAVDYIRKPFSPSIVAARVKNHLILKLAQEDLKVQNEILKENIRLREDVERITRHDLKTPLNAIINMPKLLIEEGNLTADQVEMMQMLEESAFRMLEMVNSSLDLYKMETGQYQLHPTPVDLLKLVKQIHGQTREVIHNKKLTMSILYRGSPAGPDDTFLVAGEEMICYSMLANLVKNAVEASPPGEVVTVNLNDIPGPLITVHNKGVIPGNIRERFFDKYATSGKEGGTGLGTYSAKIIVDTLGGKIDFETSAESGTTLKVFLPIANLEPEKTVSTPAKPAPVVSPVVFRPVDQVKTAQTGGPRPSAKNIKALIVDDYHSMRKTTATILKHLGFIHISEAEDGRVAQKMLASGNVDLVISDWNMPHMSGLELLQYVRSTPSLKHIPFIMITGEATHENVIEAAKLKVSDYIIKPYSADSLKKKVEKHMHLR